MACPPSSGAWALALGLFLACSANRSGPPPDAGPARVLVRSGGTLHAVQVEVARTDAERERGLMNRERLEAGHGMLFVFEAEDEHVFWMKDTLVPLDMIFIDGLGTIVGIVARAEPLTTSPRTVGRPSRYVLEVPGGWAEERGVKAGDGVRFEGPVLAPAR